MLLLDLGPDHAEAVRITVNAQTSYDTAIRLKFRTCAFVENVKYRRFVSLIIYVGKSASRGNVLSGKCLVGETSGYRSRDLSELFIVHAARRRNDVTRSSTSPYGALRAKPNITSSIKLDAYKTYRNTDRGRPSQGHT